MPRPTHAPASPDRDAAARRTTRRFVLGFALVEALLLGWALLSGRNHATIEDVRALEGMWIAPLGEIARHAAATVEEVRRIRRVECPEGYFDRTGRPPIAPAVGH